MLFQHRLVRLDRHLIVPHNDRVETDLSVVDAFVDMRSDQQTGNVGQHELPKAEEEQVFHVVVGRRDDVIENEDEEEDEAAEKRHANGGHQLIKPRFPINLVVIAEKGVDKDPVNGIQGQSEPEFGVHAHGREDSVQTRRFTDMLAVHI